MGPCPHAASARTRELASGTASRAPSAMSTPSRLITTGVLLSSEAIFLARTQRGDRAVTVYDRPFGRYYEDFEPGDVYKHWPGKTITEYDDHLFCMITMNHHPLHLDAHYAEETTDFGKNVVVGNYIYSLLLGMSVPDVSGKAIANLEIESLRHVAPTFHGDTIYGETTVLDKTESKSKDDRGVVHVETIGYKQDGTVVCIFRR